jgi:ABC-type protease/lipase transport system fused ATPase/permease subunit
MLVPDDVIGGVSTWIGNCCACSCADIAAIVLVGIASLLLNVLVFAGSGYMMLVYDSVCPAEASPRWWGSSRCWC